MFKLITATKMGENIINNRIDYVDLLKGLTMFGVVWLHSLACPKWLTADLVNSTFFFISGIFFKTGEWKPFIKKKSIQLLIPFIVFYILSYFFRIILHYWDFGTLSTFRWNCILDLFLIEGRADYLFVNVPLWFVLCIYVIQILYFFISKLNKYLILAFSILSLIFKDFLNDIPTPFMINNALSWIGFFAIGSLYGKFFINKLRNIPNRVLISAISIIAIVSISYILENTTNNQFIYGIFYRLMLFAAFGLLFSLGAFFDGLKQLSPIRFIGLNSLAMLCMHVPVLIIFKRLVFKLSGHESTVLLGFICSILCCIVCYFIIKLLNKYCPIIVGKKIPGKPLDTNNMQIKH